MRKVVSVETDNIIFNGNLKLPAPCLRSSCAISMTGWFLPPSYVYI